MDNIFENFVISVLKLNRLIQKIKNLEMREYGLKSTHVMCVYYLGKSDKGLTSGELMRLTLEDKAAISRAVSLLRTKELVACQNGGYNSRIRLTESGKALAEEVFEKISKAVEAGSADFTEEQRLRFYKSLEEISANLNKYCEKLERQS